MCPYRSRHYYEWMLKVNSEFPGLVEAHRAEIVQELNGEATLRQIAEGIGLVRGNGEFAEFLDEIPTLQQEALKTAVAEVVEAGGDIFFDAETVPDDAPWELVVRNMGDHDHNPADGAIVILRAPFDEIHPMAVT